jgi:methylated-DNA-[protein]-cysteine S-methyltransferase
MPAVSVELRTDMIDSVLGPIVVITDEQALCALDFGDCEERMKELLARRFEDFVLRHEDNPLGVSEKVRAYLDGDLHSIDGVPVDPGGTEFQRTVWSALRAIPVGSTCTYGQLAASIGRPTATRAVGLANGRNPVAIVIPCHRVIGSNAGLTGYGGGLPRKEWLLRHEGALL